MIIDSMQARIAEVAPAVIQESKCLNCNIEIDGGKFCPSCRWLSRRGPISPRGTCDERLVNRRWQMRFNRGELK